jgi:uncharacterized protein (DUF885 family)
MIALLLLAVPLAFQGPTSYADSTRQSRTLATVSAEVARHQLETDVYARLVAGLPLERLPDVTRAGAELEGRWAAALLGRLAPLTDEGLGDEERITLRVLRWQLAIAEEGPRYHALSFADVTPYSSQLRNITLALAALPRATAADSAHHARLQRETATYLLAVRDGIRERAATGVRLASDQVPQALALLRALRESPELRPAQWALDSLIAVFDTTYVAAAPRGIGLWQYPGGREAYRFLVRSWTTTERTPEEIHAIGLREVARVEREMALIRTELGFRGTAAQFIDSLRRDARFYARTPEEVGERLTMYLRRIEPVIGTMFTALPRARGDVQRLDPRLEASQTFGYYDPPDPRDPVGHYMYNASRLPERSQLSAGALLYHELLPGHHLQFALALENAALPEARRSAMVGAYTEGWGEYASMLAAEMGMYRDPWERYGRLLMEMFIAARLVVDTGINEFGWSRDSATAYMAARVIESPTQLATETLRYGADINGQALSYKIGAVELVRLRARAREALGPAFDIREFHDVVLASGALPMTVLEWKVDRWIAGKLGTR